MAAQSGESSECSKVIFQVAFCHPLCFCFRFFFGFVLGGGQNLEGAARAYNPRSLFTKHIYEYLLSVSIF